MKNFARFGVLLCCLVPAAGAWAQDGSTEINKTEVARLLKPSEAVLEKTRKPVVLIELSRGADKVLGSKIGGTPYLPAGASIPKDEAGKDMHLLAQINFAEVPRVAEYPSSGILQFFIAQGDHFGANFDGKLAEEELSRQRNFRIVFHEKVEQTSKPVEPSPPKPNVEGLPFNPAVPLLMSFKLSSETINAHDGGFEKVIGKDFLSWTDKIAQENKVDEEALADAVDQYLGANDFAHKIGGYPSFTQEDPRKPDTDYQLLLQVGSEDINGAQIMWGDLGVAGFFIRPADLKRRDFSKVLYTWDCS